MGSERWMVAICHPKSWEPYADKVNDFVNHVTVHKHYGNSFQPVYSLGGSPPAYDGTNDLFGEMRGFYEKVYANHGGTSDDGRRGDNVHSSNFSSTPYCTDSTWGDSTYYRSAIRQLCAKVDDAVRSAEVTEVHGDNRRRTASEILRRHRLTTP